jgi:hypothetical protein
MKETWEAGPSDSTCVIVGRNDLGGIRQGHRQGQGGGWENWTPVLVLPFVS